MKETQKIFSSGLTIIADYREKKIIEKLKKMDGIKVLEMSLPIADFICSNEIGIERKSYSDFASSIVDGRLFSQAEELSNNFSKPIIIIEGFSSSVNVKENAMLAAKAVLISKYGISIMNSRNEDETAKIIYWIAKKSQDANASYLGVRLKKKKNGIKNQQEVIVASLPGVSSVLSRRLLEKFGSPENVFTASEDELTKVKGIGKKLAKRIKKILSEKYH